MMKKFFPAWLGLALVLSFSVVAVGKAHADFGVRNDAELLKDPGYWRAKAPWVPTFGFGINIGFFPNYFAPSTADVIPYVSSGLSLSLGWSLAQGGVRGYWSDLRFGASWGLSKALTDNIGSQQIARQLYSRDVGISMGKQLFREKNTGINVRFSVGFKIPTSLPSWQSTIITSVNPGIGISKSFGRLSLGYGFGTNFNFFRQDSGLYNPDLAGIPGLNRRWGMSHRFSIGLAILPGLSVGAGASIGVGYSFGDNYTNPDGPQIDQDNLTPADLASFPLNEGNSFGIGFSISYRILKFVSVSLSYSNAGRQFEWQFDRQGQRHFIVRNPFKLQNGSFGFSIGGGF